MRRGEVRRGEESIEMKMEEIEEQIRCITL